jgi:hypothetical protein
MSFSSYADFPLLVLNNAGEAIQVKNYCSIPAGKHWKPMVHESNIPAGKMRKSVRRH